MNSPVVDYYILFRNHTEGMTLHSYLRQNGISVRICPAPRALSECCGMALLIASEDLEAVETLVEQSGVPIVEIAALVRDIDTRRDRFC